MNYKLNRITEMDIFYLAKENVELIGDNLITAPFMDVLALASTLKANAVDVGEGNLHSIPIEDLSDILNVSWYLLIFADKYQIVRTSGTEIYNLPTNCTSFEGSLDSIFTEIIRLEPQ